MNSNEEYLENLLQSMMNGKVAAPSEEDLNNPDRHKSAIAMLTGEEPERTPSMGNPSADESSSSGNMDNMEAMLAEMVANLDESDDGIIPDGVITDDMVEDSEPELDLSSLGIEDDNVGDLGLLGDALPENADLDAILGDIDMNDSLNEPAFDEAVSAGPTLDEGLTDSAALDGNIMDEIPLDELSLDDFMSDENPVDETGMNEIAGEPGTESFGDELSLDDLSLDDMLLDEIPMEETPVEGTAYNDTSEDSLLDGLDLDEMLLEEPSTDDLALEESGMDDMSLDGLDLDEMLLEPQTENSAPLDGLDMDDISLDENGLEDLGFEDSMSDGMSLDDLDLDSLSMDESGTDNLPDDFSLEENGMEEDLAEIHDLLGQTEQGDVDDEMLALLESVSDSADGGMSDDENNDFAFLQNEESGGISSEEGLGEDGDSPKEKKKKRRRKKKGKKDAELQDNLAGSEGTDEGKAEEKEKKPGAFARFLAFLTETDEEENADSASADENTELLEELSAEDKKEKKKKDKKEKKEKKGKKAKKASGEEEGEESAKAAKKKKPKKEKKEKAVEEDTTRENTGKKLSKKKVIPVILFCATVLAGVLILSTIVPDYLQKRDAQVAYDMGNYNETFDLLYGKELNEEEEIILHKSTLILQMERKLESYQNASKIGSDELATLNTLVQGVALYFEMLPEAEQYHVTDEVTEIYQEVLSILYAQYGLSETDVMDIIASEDDIMYTQKLASIVYGIRFGNEVEEEPDVMEDILPEEQEILDGMPEDTSDLPSDVIGLDLLEGIMDGMLNGGIGLEGSDNGSNN